MSFTDIFKGLLGGDPIKGIQGIIEEFHLSPEDKAKLAQATQELELKRIEIEAARDQALLEVQSKNITAETQSEDPFVRRTRPGFLWVIIAGIAVDLIVIPLLQIVGIAISSAIGQSQFAMAVQQIKIIEIPSAYLELFGVAFLGYTGARTWEKSKGISTNSTGLNK